MSLEMGLIRLLTNGFLKLVIEKWMQLHSSSYPCHFGLVSFYLNQYTVSMTYWTSHFIQNYIFYDKQKMNKRGLQQIQFIHYKIHLNALAISVMLRISLRYKSTVQKQLF